MAAMKDWMIKAVARTLLVACALFLLKPVMPVLIDKLAHTFWENVHVAVVHKINGKEHVHYELRKAAADNEKDKGSQKHNPSMEEDVYSLPARLIAVRPAPDPVYMTKPSAHYLRSHNDADKMLDYPPPRQA